MRLFHVTDAASAERVRNEGFADSEVIHDDAEICIGVWLADRCLAGENDVGPRHGPRPDTAIVLDLPDAAAEEYERREEGKPYREFCVPAAIVNRHPVETILPLSEVDPNDRRRMGEPLEKPPHFD